MNVQKKCEVEKLMDEIFTFAAAVVEEFAVKLVSTDESVRTGGALDLLMATDSFRLCKAIGTVSEIDCLRYGANAVNKNNAMSEHGVIISELVADAEAQPPVYGGGIQLSCGCYLSFSGFPPEWDQAFCLMIAIRFDLITPSRINSIIEKSGNPLQARAYLLEVNLFLVGLDISKYKILKT